MSNAAQQRGAGARRWRAAPAVQVQVRRPATVRRGDGFTLGVAFAGRDAFFSGGVQLSPCDSRLGLANNRAQVALFRPQVDEISLLTVNSSSFDPVSSSPPPCYPPNPSKISRPISKNLPALGICFFLNRLVYEIMNYRT